MYMSYICVYKTIYAHVTDHTVSTAVLQTASDTQINMVLYHNRTKETWRGSRSVTGLCRFEWVICSVSILKPSLNINYTTYYCTRKMRFCCFSPFIPSVDLDEYPCAYFIIQYENGGKCCCKCFMPFSSTPCRNAAHPKQFFGIV